MELDFITFNIIALVAMLAIASYLDLKHRRVSNHLWYAFTTIAALLQGFELIIGYSLFEPVILTIIVSTLASYLLYYFRIFNGADSWAIVLISIALPIFYPNERIYTLAPLITLTNSFLILFFIPPILAFYNGLLLIRKKQLFVGFIEPTSHKIIACLLGFYQVRPRPWMVSLETSTPAGRKFSFILLENSDVETEPNKWVKPAYPFIVFIVLGLLVTLFFGDLLTPAYSFMLNTVK